MLAQRYRVVARIGAGGMGVVYRAWDDATDRYVVIKMPKRELIGDPTFLQRFAQEMSALRALSHASVVPITDIGNEQGTPFAVMPYLAGGSLKQRRPMLQDGRIAPEEPATIWRWLPAIAKALDFVHASSYVHRDVKPDNILFDGPGTAYLSDFGVAKLVFQAEDAAATRGLTGTGFALGTPEYMAPELINGAKASPRVDQYALAVMTYELLAGRKPFDGPTPAAVIIAHATGSAPPLTDVRSTIPHAVSVAVARGMSKNPDQRFESCTAFARGVLATVPRPAAAEKLQLMCPQCGRLLNVKPDWAGKEGNCPRCKTALTIGADLRSLWIPSDKKPSAAAGSQRLPVGQFQGTPSRPVRMPPPTPRPATAMPVRPQPVEPENAFAALKEQFAKSVVLQGVAAILAMFALVVVFLTLGSGRREKPQPPTAGVEVAHRPQQESDDSPRPEPDPVTTPRIVRDPDATPEPAAESPPEGSDLPDAALASTPDPVPDTQPIDAPAPEDPPVNAERTAPGAEVAELRQPDAVSAGEAAAPDDEQQRLPVPDAAAVTAAVEVIKQAFEDEYKQAEKRRRVDQLVEKLRVTARSTEDSDRCYALLSEAERLSLEAFDLKTALAVVGERADRYAIDRIDAERAAINALASVRTLAEEDVFADAIAIAKAGLEEESLGVAADAANLAVSVAKAIDREQKAAAFKAKRDAKKRQPVEPMKQPLIDADALLAEATALQKKIRGRQELFDAYTQAEAALQQSADDPAANATVARYLCFTRRDWDKGLGYLAKSGLATVADVAGRQLALMNRAEPAPARDVLGVAGDWWGMAEDESLPLTADDREAILDFAAVHYSSILDELEDPTDRTLAQKRGRRAAGKAVARKPPATLAGLLESPPPGADTPLEFEKKSSGKITELTGRTDPQLREQLLERYGGSPATEAAVNAGLAWLIKHQMPDGGWSFDLNACPDCKGQCSNSARSSSEANRCAATALALMCFYGRGQTHRDGPYKDELKKGIGFLTSLAALGGGRCYTKEENLYSQGLAGIALCEGFALTKDPRLKIPAQAAVAFIAEAQDPEGGGWRYSPRQRGDTSASGWQFMALKSADTAGLQVNPLTLRRFTAFLDAVQEDQGAAYGYTDRGSAPTTSAIGLLCRSYVGWKNDHPAIIKGIGAIAQRDPSRDVYALYYIGQLLRRCGGQRWQEWQGQLRDQLLAAQVREGHAAGSWYDGFNGGHGPDMVGRLYTTTFVIMVLETYYRYLSPTDIEALK